MIGINFQPGMMDSPATGARQSSPNGVQEAVKVLSLRLPKTVGAQSVAPQGLLQSQGGGGRVESVVQAVLAKMFPGGASAPAPSMPNFNTQPSSAPDTASYGTEPSYSAPSYSGPSFGGSVSTPSYTPPRQEPQMPYFNGQTPRVVVGNPLGTGDFLVGSDGRPAGNPGGVYEAAPNVSFPTPSQDAPKSSPFPDFSGGWNKWGGGQEQDNQPAF